MKINNPSPENPARLVAAILAVAFILILPGVLAQAPVPKIMPLGDSITRGTNDINYPNGSIPGGYRRELGYRLAAAGLAFDFVGASSDNAYPGMDPHHNGNNGFRTDQVLANLSAWLAAAPDTVLLHIGSNDILQDIPVATAANQLSAVINAITANAPARKLYVATIIPITQSWQGRTAAYLNGNANAYNVQVRSLVQQFAGQGRKVFLVEMNGSIALTDPNPANNFYQPGDGIHPGQAGYNQMGVIWFNAIRPGEVVTPPVTGTQLLVNGGFESDYAGWTRSGNHSIKSGGIYVPTEGARLVAFNSENSTPNGVLAQTFATTPGVAYSLTFDAGVLSYTGSEQRLQVSATGSSTLFSQTYTMTGPGNGGTRWVRQSLNFTANSTATTLTFRDLSTATNALDLVLDNIRVTGGAAAPNTAPVAVGDSYTTARNTALAVAANGVLANDTDAQANPLTAVLRTQPANGGVVLNANGGFTYTPATNFTGADSFTYHANDGLLDSNVATMNVTVSAPLVAGALVNGSFESGYTGWTTTGNQAIQSAAPYAATHGGKLVSFNGGNLAPNATLSQSFATNAGQTYTLAFDAGVLSYNTATQTLQVTATGASSLLSRTITLTGAGGGSNRWTPQSFTFVANSATTTLTFRDLSTTSNSLDMLLDNVRVGGAASLAAAPQESPGTSSLTVTPAAINVSISASRAGTYFLERSADLIAWEPAGEPQIAGPGLIEFQDSAVPATEGRAMFYRIGLDPE